MAPAALRSGIARRRRPLFAVGRGACRRIRHGSGRHAQHILLVLLDAPLECAVGEEVLLQRLAVQRAQAIPTPDDRLGGSALVPIPPSKCKGCTRSNLVKYN